MNAKKIVEFSLGPIGGAALGIITLPIIAWNYSTEDVGRIAMLQVVSSFCILLFSLGLDQAYVREYHETHNKSNLLKLTLFPGLLLLSLTLAFCFLTPISMSSVLFSIDSKSISVLVGLCISTAFFSRFLSLILRMQERGLAFSMSQILPKLLFVAIIGAYAIFSFGLDFFHLILAHTLSSVAVAFVCAWNTRSEWLSAYNQDIDKQKLKSLLEFGSPLILGGLAFWGLTTMDKIFLRNLSSFDELAIYSVTSSFAAVAVIFQSVFSTVWAPTVYKWAAEGINLKKIDTITEYMLAAVVVAFTLTGLLSWLIEYFLPEKYSYVQYILPACMAYPLFYTLSETTVVGLGVTRKSSHSMLASIISVFFNVIGNYLFVPSLGASGAAISTAISFWIFLILRTELSCRAWRPLPRLKLYSCTLACLLMAIFFSLKGQEYTPIFLALWLLSLLISTMIFKNAFKALISALTKLVKHRN
ncbi:Polysaccharide biosynthesis protein [compost metagenome]